MGLLSEFREFAVKGNVIDLAVGIIIGAAFTAIVNSLVKDLITPVLGLLIGGIDFSNLFVTIRGPHEKTLAAAQAAVDEPGDDVADVVDLPGAGGEDVARVAGLLGGGGHRPAAGYSARGTRDQVIESLLGALP